MTKLVSTNLIAALWEAARPVAFQSYLGADPDHPGHDDEGIGRVDYRALRIGKRVIVLAWELAGESEKAEIVFNSLGNLQSAKDAASRDRYEGWSLHEVRNAALGNVSAACFTKSVEGVFTPLEDSLVTPEALFNTLAAGEPCQLGYLVIEGDAAQVSAIAGFRTSVTTGAFLFDESLCFLLSALGFSVTRVKSVAPNACSPEAIEASKKCYTKDKNAIHLVSLKTRLAQAEAEVASLREKIARLTLIDNPAD